MKSLDPETLEMFWVDFDTRAGALDQGNTGQNLADAVTRGLSANILFLAGTAINSIKNAAGKADPKVGAEAMRQAIEIHPSGEMKGADPARHLSVLMETAVRRRHVELQMALRQRYPEFGGGH